MNEALFGSMGKCLLRLVTHLSFAWGLSWLTREKCFMREFACCLLVGTSSVEVMATCVCMLFLFDSVMLLIVLASLLVFVLWSSVLRNSI